MSERQFLTGAEKRGYGHLHKEKPKKYYMIEYAYMGNTKIRVFAENGNQEFEKIVNDYNVEGYCKCLEDMGYIAKKMKGDEILTRIDPGTGLTLDQLVDAFVSNPIEAKNLKDYIVEVAEAKYKEEE